MQSLDARFYVATPADIASIAKAYSQAMDTGQSTRGTYLRALVATTQAELGVKPRLRTTESPVTDKAVQAKQLEALELVHARFYEVVLNNVDGNAEERNRRSGFARSAVSTVRAYIRAANDITSLSAMRVTKAALAEAVPTKKPRPASLPVLRNRVDTALSNLTRLSDTLAKVDKTAAIEVLNGILSTLANKLSSYGGAKPVADVQKAIADRVPFRTPVGVFYPVARAG